MAQRRAFRSGRRRIDGLAVSLAPQFYLTLVNLAASRSGRFFVTVDRCRVSGVV